ncbi:hypothetical protein [Terricaulis sp.]|uniref:hypothetical protein n=1 Tax=Terricaulis sp. TaxID=2768686 RepID=UPI003784A47E
MRALILAVAAAVMLLWTPAASAQTGNLITGQWEGSIAWDDGGVTDNVSWTFSDDGTFVTGDNYRGVWSQYGDHAVWIINVYPRSVYEGDVSGATMTARMHNMEGIAGTATLTRRGQTTTRRKSLVAEPQE